MFVSAKPLVLEAKEKQYAVGQFNINNLEWAKAVLETAQECQSPVILGVAPKGARYMGGYGVAQKMAAALMADLNITVPVALHLDHGSYDDAKSCIKAGFSSIMYDGSSEDFTINLEKTKKLAGTCEVLDISLEAEVGAIGGVEDDITGTGEFADPSQCVQMAKQGITMLAAGIGNIHGKYPGNWPGLRFDILEAIAARCGGIPMVLHGGSGIPDEMVQKAIQTGVSKVNVNTECMLSFHQAVRKTIESGKDLEGTGYDPREFMASGVLAIKQTVREKIQLFGSFGKA